MGISKKLRDEAAASLHEGYRQRLIATRKANSAASEVRPDAAAQPAPATVTPDRHSPLPWRWDDMGNLLSSDDKVVLSIGCGYDGLWGGDYPSEANAALIVRCVNQSTHRDARLAAIEEQVATLQTALSVSGDTEAALWDERKVLRVRLAAIVQKWKREIEGYVAGSMMAAPVGEMNRASADVARRILAELATLGADEEGK